MNTTEIINSIKEHVAAAYTAVTEKNGTIPEQKNLSNLAAAISSIQVGSSAEGVNNPYIAKNTTELLNYCNEKYEGAIVKVEDLTKTVEREIMVGDTISKLYLNTSITPDFSSLDWSNPDYAWESVSVINILQSEEHLSGDGDISLDGIAVIRYDISSEDSNNPYRYSLYFAGWFVLWTDAEFLHAKYPDDYPAPGWNYTGLKSSDLPGIKDNVFSINSLIGQVIHVKAMKNQDLWKSFISSTQDAWESKYYKIGKPNKNILTSPANLTCRSGNSIDLAYALKLNNYNQWIINLTLGNTTVNKVVKQTNTVLSGVSIDSSRTLVELDWTSGNTNGVNVDFGNDRTINLFIGDRIDFNDTNHQGQYNSSASTFIINYASSAASGYELTINSITPISSYDEYHCLVANNNVVALGTDIKEGKGAFNVNGEFVIGEISSSQSPPQLNSVIIGKSGNNINIGNPSSNGSFVAGYKVYTNGELKNELNGMTFDLLSLAPNKYTITVRAKGNGFIDSVDSNAVDVTVFNIVYNLTDINASIDTTKITNGQTLSFTLTPVTNKYLPLDIQIECNGQTLDYTYDDYSGAVNISTIALEYGDGTQSTISITAAALDTPKLHAPTLSIDGDILYARPSKSATSLEYYANNILFSTDADLSFPTFDVVAVPDAEYGFELNSAGYYVSKNYHIQNSAALCKVIFNVPSETEARLDCINYAESGYDYGIISQLDKTLLTNNTDDGDTGTTNVLKNFKNASSANVQTVTFTVPAGEHFIYVKYRKDGSADNNNDTLQFKVNLL